MPDIDLVNMYTSGQGLINSTGPYKFQIVCFVQNGVILVDPAEPTPLTKINR